MVTHLSGDICKMSGLALVPARKETKLHIINSNHAGSLSREVKDGMEVLGHRGSLWSKTNSLAWEAKVLLLLYLFSE